MFLKHFKKAKYLPKGPDWPPRHLSHCFPIHLSPTFTPVLAGTRDLLQEQVCLLVRTQQREVWIPIFWTDVLPAEGSACRLSSSLLEFNFKDTSFFFFPLPWGPREKLVSILPSRWGPSENHWLHMVTTHSRRIKKKIYISCIHFDNKSPLASHQLLTGLH